jgi:hypothetical protein
MKNLKHLNEEGEQIYSEAQAKELLNVQAWYNKTLQQLNDQLAKKKSDVVIKYMKLAQQQAIQTAAKTAANAQTTTAAKTGPAVGPTVNTAGETVNAQGNKVAQESYSDIMRVKEVINEENYDTRYADSETVQDLKDYMDAENVSYIEDEDETTLDFDKNELDPEWQGELDDLGLEELDKDVETDDILDVTDDEDEEEPEEDGEYDEDEADMQDEIDEKKVFYVKVTDAAGDFTGKIYKLFDEGDWRAKVIDGESKTFEQLNYDPDFDDIDIIAFLRENYDDAELISEDEYNEHIESPDEIKESLLNGRKKEEPEEVEEALDGNGNALTIQDKVRESHTIPTFNDYLNETR